VPRAWLQTGARCVLDLGVVKDIARVSVNGRRLETLWKPPYRTDVTGALKAGANRLEIEVTNQWTNRLIGDKAAGPGKSVLSLSSSPMGAFGPPPALSESGLIGPVRFLRLPPRQ